MNFKGFLVGIYSFFSLIIGIVLMFLFKNKIHIFRKIWAYSMIKIIGIKVEEIGKLDVDANIIAMNHNSMLDVILLEYFHDKDIAWVANKKLASIPLFGLIFSIPNLILINPNNKSSLKTLYKKSKENSLIDRPIGIFPEGTRGNIDELKSFQIGTKLLVEKNNLSIQPIVLINTRKRLDTKTFRSSSGLIKIIYLETIYSDCLKKGWYEQMEKSMSEHIMKYKDNRLS